MATLTQTPPTNPTNQISPTEPTSSNAENASCLPTNQIAPSARPNKPKKFVMFPDDSDNSDLDLELDDDPLSQLECTNQKSILDEEIKFKPASESSKANPNESALRELEKKGLLIRVGYEESSIVATPPNHPQPPPKPLTPLYNPCGLKMDWNQPRKIGSGLYNLGNTCFLNSVLQCLTYTPPLANYFFSREHSNMCKLNGFCAMCFLQKHYFQSQNQSSFYPVRPTIVSYLHKVAPCFHPGRQEDAHEFLRYLIDAMQNSCLANSPSKISQDLKCTTLIHQIFGGQVMSQVTCLNCQTKSDTFEPMLDLSLHIKGCGSIQEALRRATSPDRLEGSNSYLCEKCKKKCPAQKLVSIFTPPRVLTIHLKRFSFGSQLGFKLQTKIRFSSQLDISPYMKNKQAGSVLYKLYAVLVHSGFTCNSGHYYCYVVGPNGNWHKMNDTYVTPAGEHFVMDSEAYMLFYRQITKPPQQKPQNKLVIEGLSDTQPSLLSTKQQNNKSPLTPNNKQTDFPLRQSPILQPQNSNSLFEKLKPAQPNFPKKTEIKFITPKKFCNKDTTDISHAIKTHSSDTSDTSNNSISEEHTELTHKESINSNTSTPNNSNGSINSNTDLPAEQDSIISNTDAPNSGKEDLIKSITDSMKEHNSSINSYKAGTSKPVAVVTPKQTDTSRTPSRISSSAVHKENAFKTPTHPLQPKKFYKNTNIVVRKKAPQPNLDTAAVEDRVKQAQKNRRVLVQSNLNDELDEVDVPSKKPKLDSTPVVNKVAPLVSEIKIDKLVSNKIAEDENNRVKTKLDFRDEKPQVNKGFSITGVQGVKPTAVVPPANVEARNTESADQDVVQSSLVEVSSTNEESGEGTKSKKVKNSERRSRQERHKEKYLRKILIADSKTDEEMLVKKAIKKSYFRSIEELESELLEFEKKRKSKVEKRTKGSREKRKKKNLDDEVSSSPDTSRYTQKKTHKPTNSSDSSIISHKHTHKSNSDRTDKPHRGDKPQRRTDNSDNSREESEYFKELKTHSFQRLGGNLKSWDGERSALGWKECEKQKIYSDSESDLELERGKLPKKKKSKPTHDKPTSHKFQAGYTRKQRTY